MPFSDFIDQLEVIPLDGEDLIQMSVKLNNPLCKWMLYDDLQRFNNIEQLFTAMSVNPDASESGIKNNTMYILLSIKSQSGGGDIGHWISIIKYGVGHSFDYGHYDSYGLTIDQELSFTHEKPFLSKLLTGVRFEENRAQHQLFKDKKHDVNTCGRHTVVRSLFYYLSNEQYNRLIIKPILEDHDVRNPDVMVSLLTGFLPPNDEPVREFFMQKALTGGSLFRGTPF